MRLSFSRYFKVLAAVLLSGQVLAANTPLADRLSPSDAWTNGKPLDQQISQRANEAMSVMMTLKPG